MESDAEFLAAVETFVGQLEQFAGELSNVTDQEAALAIEQRMRDTNFDLNLTQSKLSFRSVGSMQPETLSRATEYRPRIEQANRTITIEMARINRMLIEVRHQRAMSGGWGRNGPPRP